jgi:SAM-dependent methyltransferase
MFACGVTRSLDGDQRRKTSSLPLSPMRFARARAVAEGLPNVDFHEGDIEQGLPFADSEFSAILCTTAFHHFTKQADALAEMARVLGPGGRLVIADANADELVVRLLDLLLRVFQRSHVGFRRASQLASDLHALRFPDTSISTMCKGGYAIIRAQKRG